MWCGRGIHGAPGHWKTRSRGGAAVAASELEYASSHAAVGHELWRAHGALVRHDIACNGRYLGTRGHGGLGWRVSDYTRANVEEIAKLPPRSSPSDTRMPASGASMPLRPWRSQAPCQTTSVCRSKMPVALSCMTTRGLPPQWRVLPTSQMEAGHPQPRF